VIPLIEVDVSFIEPAVEGMAPVVVGTLHGIKLLDRELNTSGYNGSTPFPSLLVTLRLIAESADP